MPKTRMMEYIEAQNNKDIVEVLIDLFEQYGSQVEVAKALGIDKTTLSHWLQKLSLEQKAVLVRQKDKS